MFTDVESFYRSKEWESFRAAVIQQRVDPSTGATVCERCGRVIVKRGHIILHHICELSEKNVLDAEISLNPENVEILCMDCHNREHERFGYGRGHHVRREVVLVHGAPCSGKSEYVRRVSTPGDLVVDIDRIWAAVGWHGLYDKPEELTQVVFAVRDALFDAVRYRVGWWRHAYIIDGGATEGKRKRLFERVCASRAVMIDTPRGVCAERAKEKKGVWIDYVNKWFDEYDGLFADEKITPENFPPDTIPH